MGSRRRQTPGPLSWTSRALGRRASNEVVSVHFIRSVPKCFADEDATVLWITVLAQSGVSVPSQHYHELGGFILLWSSWF